MPQLTSCHQKPRRDDPERLRRCCTAGHYSSLQVTTGHYRSLQSLFGPELLLLLFLMAWPRERRGSMDQPLNLTDSRSRLLAEADSFARRFEETEPRLRALVVAMTKVSEDLEVLQGTAGALASAGVVSGGARVTLAIGLGLLVCLAPWAGGLGLAAAAAVLGGVVVTAVNVGKLMKKNRGADEVVELGAEFMEAVGPMREGLEEIRRCETLEEKEAEVQVANTLEELEELEEELQRASQLRKRSRALPAVAAAVLDELTDLLALMASVLRVTVRQQDRTLAESIVQSARLSLKVTTDLRLTEEKLRLLRRP